MVLKYHVQMQSFHAVHMRTMVEAVVVHLLLMIQVKIQVRKILLEMKILMMTLMILINHISVQMNVISLS